MKRKFLFWALLLVCGACSFKTKAQDSLPEAYTPVRASVFQIFHNRYYPRHAALKPAINYPDFESGIMLLPAQSYSLINDYSSFDFSTQYLLSENKYPLNFPSLVIPVIGITYGVVALHDSGPKDLNLSTNEEIREDHPYFVTHVDNYLQWSPAAAVIGLNIAGVHEKHPFGDELSIYGVSTLIMAGSVFGLKHITHEERPDHSGFTSFPSGHTATAFAAAEWFRTEYWQRSPWIGMAGYAAAAATGVLRVYNNRHWVSDVVAGAAIGFLSTRIAYAVNPWIEQHIFRKKNYDK